MMRTGADEARSPKYSHVERERRFLVDPAALPHLPDEHVLIEGRYIVGTRCRLRRMTDGRTGEVSLKLAKKYDAGDPTARPMVNAYLTADEYMIFAALPAQPVVKRRYPLLSDGSEFGVDVFDGELVGLYLAEIEKPAADTLMMVARPSWASCEVTSDERFQGGALAQLDQLALAELLALVG